MFVISPLVGGLSWIFSYHSVSDCSRLQLNDSSSQDQNPDKSNCPENWEIFDGKCYIFIKTGGKTWSEARDDCQSRKVRYKK